MRLLRELVKDYNWTVERNGGSGEWNGYWFSINLTIRIDATAVVNYMYVASLTLEQRAALRDAFADLDVRGRQVTVSVDDRGLTLSSKVTPTMGFKDIVAVLDTLARQLKLIGVQAWQTTGRSVTQVDTLVTGYDQMTPRSEIRTSDSHSAQGVFGAMLGSLVACVPLMFFELGYLPLICYGLVIAGMAQKGYQRCGGTTSSKANWTILACMVFGVSMAHFISLALVMRGQPIPISFSSYAVWFKAPELRSVTWGKLALKLPLALILPSAIACTGYPDSQAARQRKHG